MIRVVSAWLLAVVVATVLGSVIQTQFNLSAVQSLGAPVPVGVRLATTGHDILGFGPFYGLVVAVALLIGFLVAGWLARRLPSWRTALFLLAGACAIATPILLMNALLPVTPIAATRELSGLLALALAGAVGGWLYTRFAA